jgi:hypothetical protein
MIRKTTCILFLLLIAALPHRACAQQLTEHDVRTTLDKLGQASAADDFTLTQAQADQLNALSPDLRAALQIQTDSPCVLNSRDPRVLHHQLVACKGLFPPGLGPQQPAHYYKFGHAFPWHVAVINLPTDPGDDPNEKLVQYTWEYDFSTLPAPVQQILKGPGPRPGMSLFRLQNGAWEWVAYR